MAISFPDTVSAAVDFSGGSVRTQGASKSQSQAGIGTDGCGECPASKSSEATDDEFNAVLGWMMNGIGPQAQPVMVATKSKALLSAAVGETGSSESVASPDFGQAAAQVRFAASAKLSGDNSSASQTVVPQAAESTSGVPGVPVPIGSDNPEPSTTAGVVVDTSSKIKTLLNGNNASDDAAASTQFQSTTASGNTNSVQSIDVPSMPPIFSSPAASDGSPGPTVQTTTFDIPFAIPSDSSALAADLTQDAMSSLERIGRSPGSALTESSESVISDAKQMSSVLSPVVLPTVPVNVLSESSNNNSEPAISGLRSSVSTELGLQKTPSAAVVRSTDDSTTSLQKILASLDSGLPATSALESPTSDFKLPVLPAAPSILPRSDSTEIKLPTGSVASIPAVGGNAQSGILQLDRPFDSQTIESMLSPVRPGRALGAIPPAADKAAFPSERDKRTTVGLSLDVISGEVSPPGVGQFVTANSFSDIAATMPGEVRQPLSSQVSHAILAHIEHSGVRSNDSLSVRLDPPELGEMRIELSKTLEGLAVRVTASEAVTMDMLLARGREIESQLRGQQMNLKSLEFLQPGMSGNSFSQGQQNAESRTSEKLMHQVRRGLRNTGPANPVVGRSTTPDSAYGLSFRA